MHTKVAAKALCNAHSRMLIVAALCIPSLSIQAECFEYRIVDTESPSPLVAKHSRRDGARNLLETRLNKLGASGWELVSPNQIVVHNDDVENEGRQTVVELRPTIALFKKKVACSE